MVNDLRRDGRWAWNRTVFRRLFRGTTERCSKALMVHREQDDGFSTSWTFDLQQVKFTWEGIATNKVITTSSQKLL